MERVALPVAEVATAEEPTFGLDACLFPMTVAANRDSAVRDEIGDDDLGRSGSGRSRGRHGWCYARKGRKRDERGEEKD